MKSETRLQQDIFTSHFNQYPQERKLLFAINNNSHNKIKGAQMKSIGVVAGVSDMIYINPRQKQPQFLELKKSKGGVQSDDQKEFQALMEMMGFEYFLIKSFEDFNEATGLNVKMRK